VRLIIKELFTAFSLSENCSAGGGDFDSHFICSRFVKT